MGRREYLGRARMIEWLRRGGGEKALGEGLLSLLQVGRDGSVAQTLRQGDGTHGAERELDSPRSFLISRQNYDVLSQMS